MQFKKTAYFDHIKTRPDRVVIKDEWILRVMNEPIHQEKQADGRVRR